MKENTKFSSNDYTTKNNANVCQSSNVNFSSLPQKTTDSLCDIKNTYKTLDDIFYDESSFEKQLRSLPKQITGEYLKMRFIKNNCAEVDILICKYIELYILLYPTDSQQYFINEVSKRLGDLRNNYYERGCKIMKLIVDIDNKGFGIPDVQLNKSTNTLLTIKNKDYLKVIKNDIKENITIKNPLKLQKYINYTPRSIQECQNQIRKNKYCAITKLCLHTLLELIPRTTKRMLRISSSSLFITVINFNDDKVADLNLLKIAVMESLFVWSYKNVSECLFECVKDGSAQNKTLAILALINSIEKMDLFDLTDVIENFCLLYIPNRLTNDVAIDLVQTFVKKFEEYSHIYEICLKFLETVE